VLHCDTVIILNSAIRLCQHLADVYVCAVSFKNILPGDCIVCFSKKDIFTITRQLEARGIEFAVIYGTLPPGKLLYFAMISIFVIFKSAIFIVLG